MRLLNTATSKLEEFSGSNIPKYAILSHRWGTMANFEGWFKIRRSCEQAIIDGYKWIWVDSCCIDKTSSAELSEAINSMFNWYRDSEVCYAYLSDVVSIQEEALGFGTSKWFTRGWTLQELLAPKKLGFFNQVWKQLGTRNDLWHLVSKATGIKDETSWEMASVAQKMSWASKRETTRIEDRAYSLMGLFGVNMPPLYGEGENAFIRLQLEILRTSDDESIFAWRDEKNVSGGLLTRSPAAFQFSGDIVRVEDFQYEKPPYSMTNKGLRMEVPLLPAWHLQVSPRDADDAYLAPIECRSDDNASTIALLLRCIKGNQFRRIASGELIPTAGLSLLPLAGLEQDQELRKTIQVKQVDDLDVSFRGVYQYKFSVPSNVLKLRGFAVTERFVMLESSRRDVVWTSDHEEMLHIGPVVGGKSFTAALELTQTTHNVDDGSVVANSQGENLRFFVVFNIFVTRARLGIIVPTGDRPMETLLKRHVQPGDWMSQAAQNSNIFEARTLARGLKIDARLNRNQSDLRLRSYEAEISFEDAVELPAVKDPVELPNNELTLFQWQIRSQGPVELPNNEVKFFGGQRWRNSKDADPAANHYIRSFLIFRELEKEKYLSRRGRF
ncbi:HET-domain-containing protein [Hyaloscypha hepaticicola]|uniref:HET-domain-containing protein n=1 Tax=Hyaloscypha hepaticicola TaxID=2082293 RepID=A0A2J6QED6_9HELO|nr:HET-domain-containing protein [Hyaloscypha hepaticicola]